MERGERAVWDVRVCVFSLVQDISPLFTAYERTSPAGKVGRRRLRPRLYLVPVVVVSHVFVPACVWLCRESISGSPAHAECAPCSPHVGLGLVGDGKRACLFAKDYVHQRCLRGIDEEDERMDAIIIIMPNRVLVAWS